MLPDHYAALGVGPDADAETIRAAYLRVMRAHHPDHRPGDPRSGAIARAANAAHGVLSDPARRAAYDRRRTRGSRNAPRARPAGPPAPSESRRPADAGAVPAAAWRDGVPVRRPTTAYSPERATVRQAFSVASLKVAAAVLAVGVVLLLLASTPV